MTNNTPVTNNDYISPAGSNIQESERPPQMASEMGGGMERNSTTPDLPKEPIPQTPYRKPFNFMKVGFIFLVMVLLIVGGYFGYQYLNSRKTASNKNESTPSVTATPEAVNNPSDNSVNTEPTSATQSSVVNKGPSEETIDFSKCNIGDGYSRSVPLGSTYLSIIDIDKVNNICQVEVLNEKQGGFVKYSCKIPQTVGVLTFIIGDNGSDFSPIMDYCTEIKSTGQ
jgi:hypothetical protein